MKRSCISSRNGGVCGPAGFEKKNWYKCNEQKQQEDVCIDWEMRPCGLLVQKRNIVPDSSSDYLGGTTGIGPMIKVKVSHDSYHLDVSVPAQSTFGDLKKVLAQKTGLEPKDQRLLFRGKEKDDKECLHMAGVGEMSKLILLEDPASKERKIRAMKHNRSSMKVLEAVSKIEAEVDKLSEKVVFLERAVQKGTVIPDKEIAILTELFMVQLLKLDSIEAEGEAKLQRRNEVHRVQTFVDALDNLKARNFRSFSNGKKAVSLIMKWKSVTKE